MENDKYGLIFQNVVVIVLIYTPTTVGRLIFATLDYNEQ